MINLCKEEEVPLEAQEAGHHVVDHVAEVKL
jgi:hypothetical protein